MANHDWSAIAAAAGIASSRTTILVESGKAWQSGGCGAAGGFGGGAILALPVLVAVLVLRRLSRRGSR